jgi:hypothetical protein
MSYQEVDIDKLRIINGECLIEIHSLVENEIDFNGTKLQIVTKVKGSNDFAHDNDVMDLVKRMKKFHYKDKEAAREYTQMVASLNREYDKDKEDHEGKQAVRHGKLVKVSEKNIDYGGWDYSCEFDAQVGDEVWFDATFTRDQIDMSEKVFQNNGKTYMLIPQKSIHAAKRGEEMISVNGYILGRLLPNDRKAGDLYLIETDTARVEVVVPNPRTPKYIADIWNNTKVKKGDIVCMRKIFAIKLDATLAETSDLVRFQPRVIVAVEND